MILAIVAGTSCQQIEDKAPEVVATKSGIEMVLIPAGRFEMGSRGGESDESPIHDVWIDAFLMDRHEMTQEHCAELARGNPWLSGSSSHFKGPDLPVEMVSWDIAALYCNERSRKEGLDPCYDEETGECNFDTNGYRLPTEAEWEYACRAGSDTEFHFSSNPRLLKQHAWYAENSGKKTHPVGQKKPNAWGLLDMHGNVAEWCNDVYGETYYGESPGQNPRGPKEGERYVLRGGAWNCSPDACRTARRVGAEPGFSDACFAQDAVGFRCVRKALSEGQIEKDGPAGEPAKEESIDSAEPPPGKVSTRRQSSFDRKPEACESPRARLRLAVKRVGRTHAGINGLLLVSSPEASDTADRPVRTGLLYDDIYLRHKTGAGHPERPERLTAIVERLEAKGLRSQLVKLKPAAVGEEWLTSVHKAEYVKRVKRSCDRDMGYVDSLDAPASKESYEVAVTAVGGVIAAIDAVMAGKVRNAFCAIRPPGHHALPDRAMGFCLFNNVAIAARYIQQKYELPKVLIVDWDVHHGNGTQNMFYDDPTVLYFGVHRYPFYPGTGAADEKGSGDGRGYTVNVPLRAGSGDREFVGAVEEKLRPAVLDFEPDFVLISAGFDAHGRDPLGGMNVTEEGFAQMTRVVKETADKHAKGRLVSVLEGGYDLDGLAASVEAHVLALVQQPGGKQ